MIAKRLNQIVRGLTLGLGAISLIAAALTGCVSKSKADAQARRAFMAGQQQGMMRMQQSQGPSVTVNGEVRNHIIPWSQGMTLGQAINAAEYQGARDPNQLIIVRNGVAVRHDPRELMTGTDYPVQAGDIIQLIQQPAPTAR